MDGEVRDALRARLRSGDSRQHAYACMTLRHRVDDAIALIADVSRVAVAAASYLQPSDVQLASLQHSCSVLTLVAGERSETACRQAKLTLEKLLANRTPTVARLAVHSLGEGGQRSAWSFDALWALSQQNDERACAFVGEATVRGEALRAALKIDASASVTAQNAPAAAEYRDALDRWISGGVSDLSSTRLNSERERLAAAFAR